MRLRNRRHAWNLLRFHLATYRYDAPDGTNATHLGFIIDDVEPSPSIEASGDRVDLYGYTSMAVAAIQIQAREIDELKREVQQLRRQLKRGGFQRASD